MRRAPFAVAVIAVAVALTGTQSIAQVKPGVTRQRTPAPMATTLTLEVQRSEAGYVGDIAVPEEWVTSMAIPSRSLLRFRFGIKQPGITLAGYHPRAEWRVYEGSPPVIDLEGTAANLIARGDAGVIPTLVTLPRTFLIDFGKSLLPAAPNGKTYFVNVVGRDHTGAFTQRMSPYVALKYEASTWGTSIQIDSLKVTGIVPQAGTLNGKTKQTEPLTAANSIEIAFAYELASAPQAQLKWWLFRADGKPVHYIDLDHWITVKKGKGTAKARVGVHCVLKGQDPAVVTSVSFAMLEGTTFLVHDKVPIRGVTFTCPQ